MPGQPTAWPANPACCRGRTRGCRTVSRPAGTARTASCSWMPGSLRAMGGWRERPKARGGRRLAGGDTHSPCRGFAAGPASLAFSSFSCPGKYYKVLMWLSATGETSGRNGADGAPEQLTGMQELLRVAEHPPGTRRHHPPPSAPQTLTSPSMASNLPPAKPPRNLARGQEGRPPPGWCPPHGLGDHTYIVVPRRPCRVEL